MTYPIISPENLRGDYDNDTVIPANITTKFREAFESYDPINGVRWTEQLASGDIIALDGNAAAASYLVISKDPLSAGTESRLESIPVFDMPFEFAAGLSLSQRTLGQEFSIELVSTNAPLPTPEDLTIASTSQTGTTLSVTVTTPHNLRPGMRIGLRDCLDSRINYPALVVASTPTPFSFTTTAGPNGTIPSISHGPGSSGFVYQRSALGLAPNGSSMIFENTNASQASFYVRSEAGDALPSGAIIGNHSISCGSTASVLAINAAATYAFQPTTEFRLTQFIDGIHWSDVGVDSTGFAYNRYKRTQVVPDISHQYRLRVRATNVPSFTRPIAQIVSATKTGTTTATVVTDVPHNLTTADLIQAYGTRDQTNFANLATPTAVASIISPISFTVVWGSAVTATTFGGAIARVNGGQTLQGLVSNGNVQSASRTNNIVSLVTLFATSGLSIGDYINAVGLRDATTGASLGLDGAYRVRNLVTTTLELEPIGATPVGPDVVSTNCGGVLIRRTDMRISYIRILDFERQRVEFLARPANDESTALPVRLQHTPAVSLTSTTIAGTVAADAAVGNPVTAGLAARNVNSAAMSATGDNVAWAGTMIGVGIVKPYAIPEAAWNVSLSLTTTTAQALAAAGGTDIKRHITALQAINTGASAVDLIILDGTTARWRITLPVNVPISISFPTELITTANTALNANLSAAGTVRINAQGYTAP